LALAIAVLSRPIAARSAALSAAVSRRFANGLRLAAIDLRKSGREHRLIEKGELAEPPTREGFMATSVVIEATSATFMYATGSSVTRCSEVGDDAIPVRAISTVPFLAHASRNTRSPRCFAPVTTSRPAPPLGRIRP